MDALKNRPASTGECPFCHGTVRSDEKTCPNCGAENPNYVEDTPRRIFHPKTIEELKEYCAERGMPLLRMRFFIGEDYKEPRAFGIYRDGDRFVVYKNKDNGNRAVRYDGPDEAHAVNELFQKLLDECHNRGIYPDREPGTAGRGTVQKQRSIGGKIVDIIGGFWTFLIWPFRVWYKILNRKQSDKEGCLTAGLINIGGLIVAMLLTNMQFMLLAGLLLSGIRTVKSHVGDGYYRFSDQEIYYKNGDITYFLNEPNDWWVPSSTMPSYTRKIAFLGKKYSDDYGFNAFDKTRAGYPDYGYYRLQDGVYYFYGSAWFRFDEAEAAWQEQCQLPQCPVGFKGDGAYLGHDHDPAWGVPDVDADFYIATLKDGHSRDGYYRFGDDLYYYYGYNYDRAENWYACGENGWQNVAAPEGDYRAYDAAFVSAEYDPAWGVPDAKDSFAVVIAGNSHGRDGYYRFGDATYYYYGKSYDPSDNWYTYDSGSGDWVSTDAPTGSYDSTYEGEDWNSDWGAESFTDSDTWDDLNPSRSSDSYDSGYDSGYDSWDSGGTDWSSDW